MDHEVFDDPGDAFSQIHPVEIVALLRELTAQLVTGDDLDDALGALVRTTTQVVPARAWCGITLIRAGGPTTAAVSADLPDGIDEVADETIAEPADEGPCLAAVRTREMVLSQDLSDEARWPAWRERAASAPVRGVLSVPLDIDDHVIGALTLYTEQPRTFTPDVQLTAMLLAEHAGLLLAAVLDRGRRAGLTAQLREALEGGETVNRAIGIVMAQRSCGAEDAVHVLQQASARLHVPLHEVADRLVTTVTTRAGSTVD
jgi:GAF domain-containing protein